MAEIDSSIPQNPKVQPTLKLWGSKLRFTEFFKFFEYCNKFRESDMFGVKIFTKTS